MHNDKIKSMIRIRNLSVTLSDNKSKRIINNFNLDLQNGNVYFLVGRNGSGKSTLVNTIMGNPMYTIESGDIEIIDEIYEKYRFQKIEEECKEEDIDFDVEDLGDNIKLKRIKINRLSATSRSNLGIFLANQYPTEIPGVGLTSFLRLIYNNTLPKEKHLSVFAFKKYLEEISEKINYPKELLKRNLNEGFSGGEKKKTEILQMLILSPKYVFLDEIDSGLDKKSTHEIFEAIADYHRTNQGGILVIVTHYDNAKKHFDNFIEIEMQKLNQ
ncbi:ATP-binding cassette domain-containing protein [Candidatus Dojkabacteria bacterium]|uniref:ATP-binding cassette domain-containing protein n=1 Tax=Candidatus Dojkabacteria bacterium TaxID=2099670 RepID=A0A3M0Z3C5_9BACT|nr:MAG: ATP-binding cassette domain-containing protein [Candidatus Dojkabacteria bacterium]